MSDEGRRLHKIPSHRCGRCADRFRNNETGAEGARHPRRGEGDLGEPGRHQGAFARGAAGG